MLLLLLTISRFINGDLDETDLPHKQFDIIISEWMGYALLYEGMLRTVVKARERYLAPGGLMVPSHATVHLAAVSSRDFMHEKYHSWADVRGHRDHNSQNAPSPVR